MKSLKKSLNNHSINNKNIVLMIHSKLSFNDSQLIFDFHYSKLSLFLQEDFIIHDS